MSSWWWTLAAVALSLITAVGVIIWLLAIASHAKPGTDQANARLDAVRTGLAAGAGAAAAVGLGLAFRRQHHQEIATELTDRDATERRITELYTKAVEQLGSDKAPVRLGGLYALERLAQDNRVHRQTIVNVICAYLRMPFSSTAPTTKHEPEAAEDLVQPANETETRTIGDTWSQERDTWHQERQVRLTAQRILGEHLRDHRAKERRSTDPLSPRFWPSIRLDLEGATLIDLDLRRSVLARVNFNRATFSGVTWFDGAVIDGIAEFGVATFNDAAMFESTTFKDMAVFAGSTFRGGADFASATFSGEAVFSVVTFDSGVMFHEAAFSGKAQFDGATFADFAGFETATFNDISRFYRATFNDVAGFTNATFCSDAAFVKATFNNAAMFGGATFKGGEDSLSFEGSRVLSSHAQHAWPTGWRLEPDGSGGYTVVRANTEPKKEEQDADDDGSSHGGFASV